MYNILKLPARFRTRKIRHRRNIDRKC